jgi:hypothetical protein
LADSQTPRNEAASQRSGFSETAGSLESDALPGAYSAGLCRSSMVLAVTDAGACSAVSVTDAACSAVSVTDAAEPSPAPSTLPNHLHLLLSRLAVPAARASGWTGSAAYPKKCCGSVLRGAGGPRHDAPSLLISVVHPRRKHEGGRGNSRSLPCPKPGVAPSMLRHSTAARLAELGRAASAPVTAPRSHDGSRYEIGTAVCFSALQLHK